ncbi:MAG: hypothetical protein IKP47_06785 [Ruminococcus sp.]|nr:hypothetical protein [Ruminococcus sp.]
MSSCYDISAARYDGEPETEGDFTDDFTKLACDIVLSLINSRFGGKRISDGIYITEYDLKVACTVQRVTEKKGHFSVELLFFVFHESFDVPLCEYVAGLGNTIDEAIGRAAMQFESVVLESIMSCFGSDGSRSVTSEFCGVSRSFRCSSYAPTLTTGEPSHQQIELFSLIEPYLSEYLGVKKAYWIKLIAMCADDEINCEVRINGAVMQGLSERICDYVSEWKDKKSFCTEKQFMMLLDSSGTRSEPPFDASAVMTVTETAIGLFGESLSAEEDAINKAFLDSVFSKYGPLSEIVFMMLPDVYTMMLFGIYCGDDIRLMIGDIESLIKKSQLSVFGYMQQAVERFLNSKRPSRDYSMNILRRSRLYHDIDNEIKNGAVPEEVYYTEIMLDYPENCELM